MERAAKERLIGAVVLVSAAWLLIPVFLDQKPPQSDAVVSRDLALPERPADGSENQSTLRRETIDLRQEARAPDAVEEAPPLAALPAPQVEQAADDDASDAITVAPATAAADQPQQGAGQPADDPVAPAPTAEAAAEVEIAPVRQEPAKTSPPASKPADDSRAAGSSAGGQLWAVQLGSFSDKDNAQRLAAKFRGEGLPAFISEVRNDGRLMHRVRIGPQASREDAEAVVRRLAAQGQGGSVVAHP